MYHGLNNIKLKVYSHGAFFFFYGIKSQITMHVILFPDHTGIPVWIAVDITVYILFIIIIRCINRI
jgi:hypothetical protein